MSRISPITRKPRTDAVRNRERLLSCAREAFSQHGGDASLEEIARQAEVGIGTLYRHFPTRDVLIEAVFRADVERLAKTAENLSAQYPPAEALRSWMLLFVDYVAAKQIIAPAFNSVAGGSEKLYQTSGTPIHVAITRLVQRAIDSQDLQQCTEPWSLLWPLIGMSHVHLGAEWLNSARSLVDVLLRGSRKSSA